MLQKIQRLQIDTDLDILKLNPETHGFSDNHVEWITELDHWGKFETEMKKAQGEILSIRDEERERELLEYTQDLNATQAGVAPTEMMDIKDLNIDKVFAKLDKKADQAGEKEKLFVFQRLKDWEKLADKLEKNPNYLYNCSLPMYGNKETKKIQTESDYERMMWTNLWFWCSLTCILVAVTTFKSKLLKDIHPSQLIGAMSVLFLMTNWHIFIWRLGEVDIVCYIGANGWLQGLVGLFGGKISDEEAIKLLVQSNQDMFKIFLQASLMLNTFLSLDLILSNKDPLKPSRKRIQLYFIITLATCIILFFSTSSYLPSPAAKDMMFYQPMKEKDTKHLGDMIASGDIINEKRYQYQEKLVADYFRDTIFLLFVTIVSSYSIGFAMNIKTQESRSDGNKIKVEYMKKHYVFVNAFSYIWILFLANSFYMMQYHYVKLDTYSESKVNSKSETEKNIKLAQIVIVIQSTFVILVMAQGAILALFRFREPVYYHMILCEVRTWFGLISPTEHRLAKEQSSQSAFASMIQQLCVDLVYTILYTVTKHTVGIKKQGRWTVYQPYDFSNQNRFLIETMLVKSSFFSHGVDTHKSTVEKSAVEKDEMKDQKPDTIIETCVSEAVGDDDGAYAQIMSSLGANAVNDSVHVNPQSVAYFEDIDKDEELPEEMPDALSKLEKSQKEIVQNIDANRKTTEKRIKDFDIGKLLGSKFQQKYMTQIEKDDGGWRWIMKDNNTVVVDGVEYTFVDREIKCQEFAPDVFAQLRSKDKFTLDDVLLSLDPTNNENIKSIFKAGEGMGKSGSFFFFSHDTNFLIKTMTMNDFNAFMYVFKYYFEHINQYPDSLIARIYGVYSVQMDDMDPVYLILMGNTKQIEDKYIKKVYDLKGSMVKRIVKGEEKDFKHTACLKDQNILAFQQDEIFLKFQEKDIEKIVERMEYDLSLLQSFNLMDYSLLFVVAYNPKYIEMHPDEFEAGKKGEYKLKKPELNPESIKIQGKKAAKSHKKQTDEFLQKMTGFDQKDYNQIRTKQQLLTKNLGMQGSNFDYNNMKDPFKNKDITYNFKNCQYEGKDKDFELNKSEKVSFDKHAIKENSTIKALSDDDLKRYYPTTLTCFQERHTFMSDDGMYLYHLGIIDYLQDFNLSKKGENAFKSLIDDGTQISAVPPKAYAERFFKFMQETVIKNQRVATPNAKELIISDTIAEMAQHKVEEFSKCVTSSDEEEEESEEENQE